MAYSAEIRTYAQTLVLNGMCQADAIKDVKREFGVDVPTSTMSLWMKAVMLDEEEQLKAAQYRQDAADRAAIRAGTASFLLQSRLDKAVNDEDVFLSSIDKIVDLANHGLVDPEVAAEAVEKIKDYVSFSSRDLSTIIKDSSSQQLSMNLESNADFASVQIAFGDTVNDSS